MCPEAIVELIDDPNETELGGWHVHRNSLKSIVDGINMGNLDALMPLYEPVAAFASQPGSLSHGLPGVHNSLAGFIAIKGTLDLKVTRVLQASDLALVVGVWSFMGTGPNGGPVKLTGHNGDVLRRQADGSWRFVIETLD
jgi:ketosteroid isomerase-like protein